MTLMLAILTEALALSTDFPRPFASLLHRPNHANVRFTTQLRGRTWKPLAVSDGFQDIRLTVPA